jgi:L-lactate dehydrogenase (cytochrome)/(S)-mandelate dehydrogenase
MNRPFAALQLLVVALHYRSGNNDPMVRVRTLHRTSLARAVSIAALRDLAKRRLPHALFDFIVGGAGDEITMRRNESDFEKWTLTPQYAVDVSRRDLSINILGRNASMPLMLAPTGLAGMFWPNGELAAIRATAEAGIPLCLSTNSVCSMEEVARAAPDADRWFQLYFLKDREWMKTLIQRAQNSGYRVLCVTIDLPVHGRRERDERNAFTIPLRPRLANIVDVMMKPSWLVGALRCPPRFGNFEVPGAMGLKSIARRDGNLFDPTITWDDVARIRQLWKGPFVVKGVLHPDDALKAIGAGADAIMISNHGGRQLDRVPSAIDALPDIAAAVKGRAQLIVDGGVRRGSDVFVARGLGATACSIGRPYLWGLCAGGQEGVRRALDIFRDELDNTMALMGVSNTASVDISSLRRRDPFQ